jgi:hypothetical protein
MTRAERRLRREKSREQRRAEAKQRTGRGLCSRCSLPPEKHPEGNCPDGGGSFTWAMDRAGMEAMVARLEALQAQSRQKAPLTRDEQTVIDKLAELTLGGAPDSNQFAIASLLLAPEQVRPRLSPQRVAEETGLPLHHVRALLDSLAEKGYVERGPQGGPS